MASTSGFLFDFGGTLDSPQHWLDRFLAHYRVAGIDIRRDELDPAYDFATRAGYAASSELRDCGLTALVEFLVRHQLDVLAREGPQYVRRALAEAGERGRIRLRERITAAFVEESRAGLERSRACIERLRPRHRIAVVSNFYGNLDRVLADAGFAGLVDVAVDSSRVGFFKPDARIFDVALNALGVAPSNAVMVGDSLGKDCAPARRMGMVAVWLCSDGRRDGDPREADYMIRSLDELLRLDL